MAIATRECDRFTAISPRSTARPNFSDERLMPNKCLLSARGRRRPYADTGAGERRNGAELIYLLFAALNTPR
jgi:hypothetical protein